MGVPLHSPDFSQHNRVHSLEVRGVSDQGEVDLLVVAGRAVE